MVDVSPGIFDLLGVTRESWLRGGLGWSDYVHPDDRERAVAASNACVASGEPFHCEYRAIHADGSVVWIREDAVLIRDAARQPHLLAGHHAQHHRADRRAARPAPSAEHVRRAGRADPRDRLPGRDRRGVDHRVRLAADHPPARRDARGVDRRQQAVVGDDARRRSRAGDRRGRTRHRVRRALHGRVPHDRPRRPREVVPGHRGDAPRRRGQPRLHARRDARHHRAARGRGASHLPRLPRQPDGHAQPRDVRRAARALARPRAPGRSRRRGARARHRQLQARQRLARPRGRRPADPAGRAAPAGRDPRHRPRRALRRRRVPDAPGRPRPGVAGQR